MNKDEFRNVSENNLLGLDDKRKCLSAWWLGESIAGDPDRQRQVCMYFYFRISNLLLEF